MIASVIAALILGYCAWVLWVQKKRKPFGDRHVH